MVVKVVDGEEDEMVEDSGESWCGWFHGGVWCGDGGCIVVDISFDILKSAKFAEILL